MNLIRKLDEQLDCSTYYLNERYILMQVIANLHPKQDVDNFSEHFYLKEDNGYMNS